MSLWTWVLVGLCVAGFALAVWSVVSVVMLALRLRARLKALQSSPILFSLESLQMQGKRLSKVVAQIESLAGRLEAVRTSLEASRKTSGIDEASQALSTAGADIRELSEELR